MYYSRPNFVSNWQTNRETRHKDYDFTCPEGRKYLNTSIYKHFGTCKDADWSTTGKAQMSQYQLKDEYETQTKSVMPAVHVHTVMADSTTGSMRTQFNDVLPQHPPGHNKMDFDTTYTLDYPPPYDFKRKVVEMEETDEWPSNFHRCQSEFTDLADYKRRGRNTWQDDIGVQGRVKVTSKDQLAPSNPICPYSPH